MSFGHGSDEPRPKQELPMEIPAWWTSRNQPASSIEALMRCAPHEEPQTSLAERLTVRDLVAETFDSVLTPEETWVLNAMVVERMSLRYLARQIGATKTTVARIRDRGLAKLKHALQDNADVQSVLREMGIGQTPR